jgi:hypothetical protein
MPGPSRVLMGPDYRRIAATVHAVLSASSHPACSRSRIFSHIPSTANIQPLWATHEPQMDDLTTPFLGERRAGRQCPFRSLPDAGAALRAGSDWPVSSPDPL